jgi:hypothetical protein
MSYLIHWPVLSAPTVKRGAWPTHASGPIAASYCSHHDQNEVVFDPVFFGVYWQRGDTATLERCLSVKRRLHVTDVVIAVAGNYADYLGGEAFDWRANPGKLHDLAVWLLDRGFRPIIFVSTADLGTEIEIYDGTMARVCGALTDLVDSAWYCIGWEVNKDRGGAWTAGQASDALLVCRQALGDKAKLIWHGQPTRTTPASYYGNDYHNRPHSTTPLRWVGATDNGAWIDADDPSDGSEMGAFYVEDSGFAEIDIVFYQTDHGANGPSYVTGGPGLDEFGQPRWWARAIECLERFLPPGTPMPGAAGFQVRDESGHVCKHAGQAGAPNSVGYVSPDWFAAPRRRGRVTWVLFETVCYEFIRGECSDTAVVECTHDARGFGCGHFGCQ